MRRLIPLLLPAAGAPAADWQTLFDGKAMRALRAEGNAAWTVEGGAIVGRQGPGGAAGDLFTEQQWTDVEVEAEWQMKWPGNSGLWFRYTGPKTGCQADFLDQPDHPGVLSGSLYCMGKGMVAANRDTSSVNRTGWNRTLLRLKGNRIEVSQNGKPVISAEESAFAGPGRIGFQVHAGKDFEGMEVRIRKLRIRPL